MQEPIGQRFAATSVLGHSRSKHVLQCFRTVQSACQSTCKSSCHNANTHACHSDDGCEVHCHRLSLAIGEFWLG